MSLFILFAILSIAITPYLINRDEQVLCCMKLLRRIRPYQLRGRDHILSGKPKASFWKDTDGFNGLWDRWRNRRVFTGLCQFHTQRYGGDPKEKEYVTRRSAALSVLTFLLILTWPFRNTRPILRLGHFAYRLYAKIADRTGAFFALEDESVCSKKLSELL